MLVMTFLFLALRTARSFAPRVNLVSARTAVANNVRCFSESPLAPSADGSKKTGTVKWFNTVKGYGFVTPYGGGSDVFVRLPSIFVVVVVVKSIHIG